MLRKDHNNVPLTYTECNFKVSDLDRPLNMILGWAHGKFCAMCPKSLVMPLSLTYEFKASITKKTSDEGTLSCFIEVESLPYYVVQYYERD